MAAGYAFTLAVERHSHHVLACGFAKNGRCAVPDADAPMHSEDGFAMLLDWTEAFAFRALPPVLRLACGSGHALALLADGRVYSWGRNDCGQTGQSARRDEILEDFCVGVDGGDHTPTWLPQVPSDADTKLFAGSYSSHALVHGQLWGWGAHALFDTAVFVTPEPMQLAHGPHYVETAQHSIDVGFVAASRVVDPELGPCLLSRGGRAAYPLRRGSCRPDDQVVCMALPFAVLTASGVDVLAEIMQGPSAVMTRFSIHCAVGATHCINLYIEK